VRFVVELGMGPGGTVQGSVAAGEADPPRPFTGWLELLRLFEDSAEADRDVRDRVVATDGH
jgi:hypothetical protein